MRSSVPAIVGVGLVALMAAVHGVKLAGETATAVRRLVTETSEQRRLDAYGDCGARGYGYVSRVIAKLPEAEASPLIKYHGYDRFGALVLPFERKRIDDRILVGINLRDDDLAEQMVTCRPWSDAGSWFVRVDEDVDTLTGFRIDPGRAPTLQDAQLDVTLYDTPQRRHELARWTFEIPARTAGPITLRPEDQLKPFSVHNRSVGLLFDVKGVPLARFALLVIPVDTRRYVRVGRQGGCTTWVRGDLEPAVRADDGPWRAWADSLASR
jgi:hypothetical protein